jgi:neutral trehalase
MEPLSEKCQTVLRENDRKTHTVPSSGLYPHQWLWDSCFSAIGWAQIDVKRAEQELFSLFKGQWHNGMLPHMIFDMSSQYANDRNMWRSWISRNSPNNVATSGVTQPPVIAEAVSKIGAQLSSQDRIVFYKKCLPHLISHHQWLYRERDPHKEGLTIQIHPYETGMDNALPWMDQLREHSWPWWVTIIEKLHLEGVINALRPDVHRIPRDQRAKNIDAMVCWDVVRRLRRKHYYIDKILHRSLFVIEDVAFNSILVRNNVILREISAVARVKLPEDLIEDMSRTEATLEQLWDESFSIYFSRDFMTNKLLREPTIASLMPLYAGTISKERADKLVKILTNNHAFWLKFPLPTVPRNMRGFEPNRYWQGPTWINTNWLIIDGLYRFGYTNEAAALKANTIEMMRESGIWEYYNPLTGEGLGIKDFSWSAALALDLLEQ